MKTYFVKNWANLYVSKDDNTKWHQPRSYPNVYSTKDRVAAIRRASAIRNGGSQFGGLNKCRVVSIKR